MTTTERKQQERQARVEKCLEYVKVITEPAMTPSGYTTYVAVNSATTTGRRYLVTIDESGDVPVATRCNCDATVRCIHMDSVDLYYQRIASIFAQEQVVETAIVDHLATYDILTVADTIRVDVNRVRCGGCGCTCGEGKGDRCHIGFCFWNSWWTENLRNAA